jgi:hypothetical protein
VPGASVGVLSVGVSVSPSSVGVGVAVPLVALSSSPASTLVVPEEVPSSQSVEHGLGSVHTGRSTTRS